MSVQDYASAATVTLRGGGVYRITGTATIDNILGLKDGETVILLPSNTFGLSGAGKDVAAHLETWGINVTAITATTLTGFTFTTDAVINALQLTHLKIVRDL